MRVLLALLLTVSSTFCFAQEKNKEKEEQAAIKKANSLVYEANTLIAADNFIDAEKEYRRAISKRPSSVAGTYNLGNSYYRKGNYDEALFRQQQAAKMATDKGEKHRAFHNIGNILMKEKKCKEAVEAYKNALRNNPSDEETRYNLGLAKICAEQQKDDQPDENQERDKKDQPQPDQQDKQDDNPDQDNQDQDKKDPQDDEGQNKNEGDKKEDEKPKDGENQEQPQQPQPQPGKLSPQQINNLLDAMNNHEQKVQEKVNAEKQKGVKIQTDKDW